MSIHFKADILSGAYLVFNTLLTLFLLTIGNGYLFVSFFIVGGHVRDFINVVYQMFNIHKILRRLPEVDGDEANTICCLVPVHNEHPSMLKQNLDGLTTQKLPRHTTVIILLLFDGIGDHNSDLFSSTDMLIDEADDRLYDELFYENWKTRRDTRLVYKIGSYNGTTVVLAMKDTNGGKKDSLIVGERLIAEFPNIKYAGLPQVDYIYHTDGDTVSDTNCLGEMLKSLVHDKELDAVSGLLRAYAKDGATWMEQCFVMMQDFQYFFSLIVRRSTESLMSATTCLPGCANMVRLSDKTERAIDKYRKLPIDGGNLLQAVTRMQGTDRRYTTLMLRQGAKLRMNWRAFVHTEPPLNAQSFINQRRRWSSNSFFNSIVLLYSANIPPYVRASTLVDIGRVFSTLFRFISYFCFWFYIDDLSVTNVAFMLVCIVVPYAYAFAWVLCIVPERRGMVAGFLLNRTVMPFLTVVAVTKMYFTSTNFAWGRTTSDSGADWNGMRAASTPRFGTVPPEPVSGPAPPKTGAIASASTPRFGTVPPEPVSGPAPPKTGAGVTCLTGHFGGPRLQRDADLAS